MRFCQSGWFGSFGAKTGRPRRAASSATDLNHCVSSGSSGWVSTPVISKPFSSSASMPVQPIS